MKQGRLEEALQYYQQFENEFPEQSKVSTGLSEVYSLMGDFEKAKQTIQERIIVKPNNTSLLLDLAEVENDMGNFEESFKLLEEARQKSITNFDSAQIYQFTAYKHYDLGHKQASFDNIKKVIELRQQYMSYKDAIAPMFWFDYIYMYHEFNEKEKYDQWLDQNREHFDGGGKIDACFNRLMYSLAFQDPEKTKENFGGECGAPFLEKIGGTYSALFESMIASMEERYEEAIQQMELFLEKSGSDETFWRMILFGLYTEGKDLDKALEMGEQLLVIAPYNAKCNMTLGQAYLEKGNVDKARYHLEKAKDIWKDADPSFLPYIELIKLMERLPSS
ncbi:MAG: tetratricopeptide repeat protein [Bacteroidota bacterium]